MQGTHPRNSHPALRHSLAHVAMIACCSVAVAGTVNTTFNVTNDGATSWIIDGATNPALTLVRGETYVFTLQNVGVNHPFYINTINTTGTANQYMTGVSVGIPGPGGSPYPSVQFNVPMNAPSSLFYNCGNHDSMYGTLNIINNAIFASGFDVSPVK